MFVKLMGLLIVFIFFLCSIVVKLPVLDNFILKRCWGFFLFYFVFFDIRKLTVERWVQGSHHIFTPNKHTKQQQQKLLHIANQFTKLDIQLNSVKNNKSNNNKTTNKQQTKNTTQRIQKSKYKNWKKLLQFCNHKLRC